MITTFDATLKTLAAAATLGLAAAGAAQAAPIYATGATIVADGPRGTENGRDDLANAFGSDLGGFFELGRGATVDFTFGTRFTGPVTIDEVTFGDVSDHPESVDVYGGLNGAYTFVTSVTNLVAAAAGGATFDLSDVYDTLRLVDTSAAPSRGFDVDRIGVSPIPVPAAGVLLLGALGALGLMARRRAA